ncbi:MAG: 4Fe-4S dicluster domain-containing protein [Anaerolineae bacterium]|nr:4Fe-4S dicluster domain-containing protein [Anaerolineae bacterium]
MLKLAGASAGGLLLQPGIARASEEIDPDNGASILFDATLCVGCKSCEEACKEWNHLPEEPAPVDDMTANTWTLVRQYESETIELYRKYQCMHCLHPGCVSVCTVGALTKTPEGPVVYDSSKCIGCRYCQYACPFGVPKFEWEKALGLIRKCTFCADRLADGLEPACVSVCPVGALAFGTRKEMLEEAHARIDQNPNQYIDHVYGEFEAGGTSVLYISSIPFSALGFPTLGNQPIAHASETLSVFTPLLLTSTIAVLSGIYWVTKRRNAIRESKEE